MPITTHRFSILPSFALGLKRPATLVIVVVSLFTSLPAEVAAEPLALWAFGAGIHADQHAKPGCAITAGEVVVTSQQPVRLELLGFPGSDLILRPDSTICLMRDADRPGRLVIDLRAGGIEVDLRGAVTTAEVEVRCAALSVRGRDTLFLIEREDDDTDYVAVVSGQAMAGIRPGIAIDDGSMAILLQARQGLSCSTTNGLTEVEQLDRRPQLLDEGSLQKQGQELGDEASWSIDGAAAATADPPTDGQLTRLPTAADTTLVAAAPPTPPATVVVLQPVARPPEPVVAEAPPQVVTLAPAPPVVVATPEPAPKIRVRTLSPRWQHRGRELQSAVR